VSLSLGGKAAAKKEEPSKTPAADAPVAIESFSATSLTAPPISDPTPLAANADDDNDDEPTAPAPAAPTAPPKMSLSLAAKPKPNNPLMKKNPLAKKKEAPAPQPEKKMSNAERIMREEIERKRVADERRGGGGKRQRLG